MMTNKNSVLVIIAIVVLFIGLLAGYFYGSGRGYKTGYDVGYNKAIADTKSTQEALAKKAAEDAASAANPFKVVNPLEGVEANPFEETAKKLNPFAK